MKIIAGLMLILSFNTFANDAEKAGLRVISAQYDEVKDSVVVEIKYKGGCDDNYGLRLRGCADVFVPYTCQVDVVLERGEVCENDMHGSISFTREELGMKTRKFTKATLIIQDPTKKSKARVTLPIVK